MASTATAGAAATGTQGYSLFQEAACLGRREPEGPRKPL